MNKELLDTGKLLIEVEELVIPDISAIDPKDINYQKKAIRYQQIEKLFLDAFVASPTEIGKRDLIRFLKVIFKAGDLETLNDIVANKIWPSVKKNRIILDRKEYNELRDDVIQWFKDGLDNNDEVSLQLIESVTNFLTK